MARILRVVLVLVAAGIGFFVALLSPVQSRNPYTVDYVVLPGESVREIGANLQSLGLVRDRRAFSWLTRLEGKSRRLQAGPYRASSKEWVWQIVNRMVAGDFQDTSVTVPEGLWTVEMAPVVAPFVDGGADSFLAAASDSSLLAGLGVPGGRAEGFLFPSTYRVLMGTSAGSLVRQMVRTFFMIWNEDLAARAEERGVDLLSAVTLASIVEAEARVAEERPRIAAVYWNRLHQNLPLQADPTVHYAMGERLARTLYDDLRRPSPYNTYLHPGLPPGPICNPGLDALKAVLWPLEGCRDLYFVAQGNGTHLFAPDFAGHLKNRRLVRQHQDGNPE